MNNKRDIYFVVETGSLAGGVRVIGELANRLVKHDWPVYIFSVNHKETLTDWFQLDGRVKWVNFYRTGTTDDYNQLSEVLKKRNGFKIATFWRTAYAVNDSAKPGEGLYLCQDVETVYVHGPIMRKVVMDTYDFPIRKIATSRWVESQLQCDYIGIGIDYFYKVLDKIYVSDPERPNKRVLARRGNAPLACARRQALKGWSQLCEVARYLNAAGHVLSTFGLDARLPMMAKHKHAPKPLDESVRKFYNLCGCYISCSLHEGFQLNTLEAMACGAPVITTNADGNMEYCEDGYNCLIGKDPEDIALKTIEVLRNPTLAKTLSKNALKTPERYRWTPVIERLEKILNE